MNEIATVLNSVSEQASENVLTLENVKRWLAEYLHMHEEEVRRFPNEKVHAHWDLLGADYDPDRDAMFLLAYFRDNTVTFLAGRGSIVAVHDFAQNTFPKNPDDVLDELSRRFWIGDRASVNLDDLVRWLKAEGEDREQLMQSR